MHYIFLIAIVTAVMSLLDTVLPSSDSIILAWDTLTLTLDPLREFIEFAVYFLPMPTVVFLLTITFRFFAFRIAVALWTGILRLIPLV